MSWFRTVSLCVLALALSCSQSKHRTLEQAWAFYQSQPPYLQPKPYTAIPPGIPGIKAADCGQCHREIYEEWRISTHARAWMDDAQFQEELNKAEFNGSKGRDVRWMCVNCHTPMITQLERLVLGLNDGDLARPIQVENPLFDPEFQLDAITCAVCHVRDGVILGPYGNTNAPHPVRKDDRLHTSDVCTQCHQAKAHFPEINLICVFDTGEEFNNSRYAQQGMHCQDCHMPAIERPLMDGFPSRPTRRHWFGGSLIPKKPEFAAELTPLHPHYPDGMRLQWLKLPDRLKPAHQHTLVLEYENAFAGHFLPTGDPERFILIQLEARDTDGNLLAKEEHRIGTQFRWYPDIEKLSDNRLLPGERRSLSLSFSAPSEGVVVLHTKASKWRISEENFNYHHLEGRYVASRVFFEEQKHLPIEK